jgi:hypothetical protein
MLQRQPPPGLDREQQHALIWQFRPLLYSALRPLISVVSKYARAGGSKNKEAIGYVLDAQPWQVDDPIEDLKQAGYLGLAEAAVRCNPAQVDAFGAYVRAWLTGCLHECAYGASTVAYPKDAESDGRLVLQSLNRPVSYGDDEDGPEPLDWVGGDDVTVPGIVLASFFLEERESYVISEWYLRDKELRQVADELCVSVTRAAQIRDLAVIKLRAAARAELAGDLIARRFFKAYLLYRSYGISALQQRPSDPHPRVEPPRERWVVLAPPLWRDPAEEGTTWHVRHSMSKAAVRTRLNVLEKARRGRRAQIERKDKPTSQEICARDAFVSRLWGWTDILGVDDPRWLSAPTPADEELTAVESIHWRGKRAKPRPGVVLFAFATPWPKPLSSPVNRFPSGPHVTTVERPPTRIPTGAWRVVRVRERAPERLYDPGPRRVGNTFIVMPQDRKEPTQYGMAAESKDGGAVVFDIGRFGNGGAQGMSADHIFCECEHCPQGWFRPAVEQ